MCKIIAIAGIKPEKTKQLWDFVVASVPHMTQYDRDGFGYAGQTSDGIFAEKWLYPKESFKLRDPYGKKESAIISEYQGALSCEKRYEFMGQFNDQTWNTTHAVTLHSRLATCGKNIANTHPFLSEDGKTSLIHNGVISNTNSLTNKTSTCDSECILNEYTKFDVSNTPTSVDLVASNLRGYYACAILTTDSNGNQYLDIFKDTSAQLVATYIPQLDAMVFCTKADIIKDICKELKWKYRTFFSVKSGVMIRLNAKTGSVVGTYEFSPVKYGSTADYYKQTWGSGYGGWSDDYSGRSWEDREHKTISDVTTKVIELTKTVSDDAPEIDLTGKTERELDTLLVEDKITHEQWDKAIGQLEAAAEREKFRQEIEKRVDDVLNTDADNPNSPFHVKSGS